MSDSQASAIRILVVEDHEMVLDALRDSLQVVDSFEVVAAVASLHDARVVLHSMPVDVIVTDLQLSDGLGTELAIEANQLEQPPATLLISGSDDQKAVAAAQHSGCVGFVSKADGFDELKAAIHAVASGASVFSADLLRQALNPVDDGFGQTLTEREREVLGLLARARAAKDIATDLSMSQHTARNHIRVILGKLGARNQLEAVVLAVKAGIVEIN